MHIHCDTYTTELELCIFIICPCSIVQQCIAISGCLLQEARLAGNSAIDVESIMNTWIRQMGYPVVNVTYDAPTKMLTLSQKHFLQNPQADVTQASEYKYVSEYSAKAVTELASINFDDDRVLLKHNR